MSEPPATAEEIRTVAEVFRLLGDPTRVALLAHLLDHDECAVHELAEATGTPQTTVSAALRLLRAARMVSRRRDGRLVHYRIADAHVRLVLELSLEHVRHLPAAGDDLVSSVSASLTSAERAG
ncbi:ArsR/SmtB family transcription factor [Nakamurella leprariae]|uniref:Helix-turn-helix transcriptional regulator n=1 Tax=Nakamurella leprariae TaxID=2803911 RepID=A0A938Y687_9ACTN|nr:metalloregulator ArsR/SmtB family transcription factor [Nakamurella leprariae]MBM9466545.1 helix-turn-helix transcriptional regulator [Nakamurella leprariae]